ncbi:MAG: DUF2796 domain-containing protein [Desulfatitalea sp.]|nr:DUF2796 domain-containing protein [Desulfatitalea sp.]
MFIKMPKVLTIIFFMLSTILLPFTHVATVAAHRQLAAHVHGVAQLNIAVEGNALSIALISPAANIVGFEHQPRTDRQKAALKRAEEKLMAGETLFELPAPARGRLIRAQVHSDMTPHGDPKPNAHDHDHKDSDKAHGHDHDSDHDHDIHSDFTAEYQFVCDDPQKLTHMDIRLFDIFPGIEIIQVQLITDSRQTGRTLTPGNNRISF